MKEIVNYIDKLENRHSAYMKAINMLIKEIVELEERIGELEERIGEFERKLNSQNSCK